MNKDITHPRMRRLIKNPRIILLDCNLEYKKGESQVWASHMGTPFEKEIWIWPAGGARVSGI